MIVSDIKNLGFILDCILLLHDHVIYYDQISVPNWIAVNNCE